MINPNMRFYNFSTLGTVTDAYGQLKPSETPQGAIKMAISLTSQSTQDNINYAGAQYIGLTLSPVSDKYIIHYGNEKLKVLYVNALGRYKQVFMAQL